MRVHAGVRVLADAAHLVAAQNFWWSFRMSASAAGDSGLQLLADAQDACLRPVCAKISLMTEA